MHAIRFNHMRSGIPLISTLVMARIPGTISGSCEDLCESVTACVTDPRSHGSYCKSDQSPPVCFGMYWRDVAQSRLCYALNDPTCPQSFPVICPSLPTTSPIPFDTCKINCLLTPECAFTPTNQASYCKIDQNPPVCFGLYWRNAERTESCYQPVDTTCPETDPITCG